MAINPSTTGNTTLPPPRRTGNDAADVLMQLRWFNDFYDQIAKVLNVPGAIETLSNAGLLEPPPTTGIAVEGTAIMLQVHNNGGIQIVPVTLGAADSGGTGFRLLRVPN